MWNWKLIYEDETIASYCDFDKIIDTEGDGEDMFASEECYQQLPPRFAVWMSLIFKTKDLAKTYSEQRKTAGLPVKGYQKFRYTLCLVEMDRSENRYRVIPAVDYDSADNELGESSLLDAKAGPVIGGLKTEWSSISARSTHRMIGEISKRFS